MALQIFTTGQIAKLLSVAPRTVSRWVDQGHLRGYRLPGSQDRRVPRDHLVAFLQAHGMPTLDEYEAGAVAAPPAMSQSG